MYTYPAGATGLDASMPLWVQAGGFEAWAARLRDPAVRARVAAEMRAPGRGWENLYFGAGPEQILLSQFRNPALRQYVGKTLAEVARMRGTSPEETAMDLVVEDNSRVGAIYFLMSEDNIRRQIALPWVSFGSDAASMASEGVFLNANPHPRAYGNFARLLGRYVRDERIIPLEEAVRRLTSLPAANLGLRDRGALRAGHYADVLLFRSRRDRRPRHLPSRTKCGRHAPRPWSTASRSSPTASPPAPPPAASSAAPAGEMPGDSILSLRWLSLMSAKRLIADMGARCNSGEMIHPSTHELMLRDTVLELLEELQDTPRENAFDRGYRQGMARALDVIKQQADAFGIGSSVGLSKFEYVDWIG